MLALVHIYHNFNKCGIAILLPLVQLKIDLCLKVKKSKKW